MVPGLTMHEGERMRRIRESLGLSQKYAAAELNITPSCLNRLEHGVTALSYRMAVRAARLYNCELGAFDESLGGPLRTIVPTAQR